MSVRTLNPARIRKQGLEALARELGPLGMVHFLKQFESGSGDYTAERKRLLGRDDVKSIVKEIKKRRAAQKHKGN